MSTTIEWTAVPDGNGGRKKGETINPQVGCREKSPGCRNCYAAKLAARGMSPQHRGLTRSLPLLDANGQPVLDKHGQPRIKPNSTHWNGEIRRVPEQLEQVLRWREPRGIFWGSMTDLFGEWNMETEQARRFVAACFGVMAATPQHTHMVLTKRPRTMRQWFEWLETASIDRYRWYGDPPTWPQAVLTEALFNIPHAPTRDLSHATPPWPLPSVWIGTTAEDQPRMDERVDDLIATPAAVHFLSVEPMLGPVVVPQRFLDLGRRAWVICGGESGQQARPMHPAWVRALRDQCVAAGVPFFMKQMYGRSAAERKAIPDDLDIQEFPDVT